MGFWDGEEEGFLVVVVMGVYEIGGNRDSVTGGGGDSVTGGGGDFVTGGGGDVG